MLDHLERLLAAATPGEWFAIYDPDEDDEGNRIIAGVGYAPPHEMEYEPVLLLPEIERRADDAMEADCLFVAAARNAAPALLRAIKAGRECADDLESVLRARYEGTLDYPSQRQRFERDMEPVLALRAALAALEEARDGK